MEHADREGGDTMPDLLQGVPAEDETRRKENTRSRLVRASVQVFAEKGLDGATIDDLVRAAGFTRGAFYSNYTTKNEVFGAAFALATEQVIQIMHERVSVVRAEHGVLDVAAGAPASAEDAGIMLALFEAVRPFGRQWCLLHTEAVAHSLRSAEARRDLVVQRRRLRSTVAEVLVDSVPDARLRGGITFEDLAQLLIGVFVDLITREQLEDIDVSSVASTTILGTLHAFVAPVGGECRTVGL